MCVFVTCLCKCACVSVCMIVHMYMDLVYVHMHLIFRLDSISLNPGTNIMYNSSHALFFIWLFDYYFVLVSQITGLISTSDMK